MRLFSEHQKQCFTDSRGSTGMRTVSGNSRGMYGACQRIGVLSCCLFHVKDCNHFSLKTGMDFTEVGQYKF